jgi:hypothetical protein
MTATEANPPARLRKKVGLRNVPPNTEENTQQGDFHRRPESEEHQGDQGHDVREAQLDPRGGQRKQGFQPVQDHPQPDQKSDDRHAPV